MEEHVQRLFATSTKQDGALKTFVVEEIRSRIMEGRYALGQRLSQNQLAQEMNTSRAPVQDALQTLYHEGLVQIIPQRGSFVFNPTQEEIAALYEVSAVYEVGALNLAMERNPQQLIIALKQTLCIAENTYCNAQEWVKADRVFHGTFIQVAANPYLTQAYKNIIVRTSTLVFKNTLSLERMQQSCYEHAKILEYVQMGNKEHAALLLRHNNMTMAKPHE